jgi:hypothetical protein
MFKFLCVCVLLAAGCVAAVVLGLGPLVPGLDHSKPQPGAGGKPADEGKAKPGEPAGTADDHSPPLRQGPSPAADRDVPLVPVKVTGGHSQLLIIQDGRVLPMERQDVPSEREGKLLTVATPVLEGEFVPNDKLVELEVAVLGVEYKPGDDLSLPLGGNKRIAMKEPFVDPLVPGKLYRFPRITDKLESGATKLIRLRVRLRKLLENDEVKEGQLVGIINPAMAIEELDAKLAKLEGALSDVEATKAMLEESKLRLAGASNADRRMPGAISRDDLGAARVTVDKYRAEKVQKESAVKEAQQAISGAWTTLDLYFIRAMIPGRIRTLYKQPGEAVKNLDPVMQIQNTKKLRVEAQVEVQDALPLQERLRRAEALRAEASSKDTTDRKYADECRARADQLTTVYVEVTKPVPPKAALARDLAKISAVAVTRGPLPRIVSANEDGMVRVWERAPGPAETWQVRAYMPHHDAVRALACSGRDADRNIVVTATSTGRLRLFDLGNLDKAEALVFGKGDDKARHTNAVNAVALNKDATLCASAGEDRAICIWDARTGALLRKKEAAHNNGITSLAFTPGGELVSAGRDGKLIVWEWKDNSLSVADDSLRGRSNTVAQLGLDPKGEKVLFDEGRELRVLSLKDGHTVGTLANPGSTGAFSTMALFSPDGKMILTNGNAPGRLQLWRAPAEGVRAAELRQLLWSNGTVTCGAFDPEGQFAVTGTDDHRILVWDLPRKDEAEKPLDANLTFVEEFLDTGLKKVTVRATIKDAKDWVIPGSIASIVVPARPPQ